MATEETEQKEKQPVGYHTQLLDLSNPKDKKFITDFLKVCWRGMKYDEEKDMFVLDPNGH